MINIVIPMAGAGSRFSVAGYLDPKPLIPIKGVPMIKVVIDNLTPIVPHRFIFICQKAHIEQYGLTEKLKLWAPDCIILGLDGLTEGAAVTVLKAKEFINNSDELIIANSDQYVDANINEYLRAARKNNLDGLIMTMLADDPKWSFVGLDESGFVNFVVEKKVISKQATVGIYGFKKGKDFVDAAEQMLGEGFRVNGEFYVAPVYNYLIKKNGKIGVFNIGSEGNGMYGLGTPADLELFISKPICDRALSR